MANCKTCGSEAVKISAFESPKCAKCGADFGSGNVEAAALSDGELREWLLGSVCNSHGVENSECEKYTCGNNCPYNILPKINNLIKTALATQKAEMASIDETEIRICEGCGRVEIKGDNGVRPPAIACCPDNTYHTIAQIKATQKSKMLALIPGPKTIDKAEWKYNAGFNEAIASVRKAFESEGIV